MSKFVSITPWSPSRFAVAVVAAFAAAISSAAWAASENTVINYTGAAVPATFTGAMDADDSTYNRAVTCSALSGIGTAVAYDTVTITNNSSGVANFVVKTALIGGAACGDANDTFISLYDTSFNPAAPLTGCLAINDDIAAAANRCSTLSFAIPLGATRVLAIAGFNNAAAGGGLFSYQVDFTGTTGVAVGGGPTKLAITAQPTPSVQALTPFNVTVQTQDAASAATNVTAATTVTVAIQTGTGALTGTATCNIAIGANSCTVTGIASNTVQTGLVLRATSSPVLTSADTTPFNVTAIPQAITAFAPTTPVVFGAAPATLTATGGASGSPIVFATTSLATVCTVSSPIVTFTGVGTCNLTANQAAAGNYSAAPQVTASIVINPAPQSITGFAPTTPVIFGAAPTTLTATGGASGSPIVFATTSLATVCTVSSPTVTFTGIGTCNLTANQAAAGNYSAAPQVTASIVINPAPQSITGFAPTTPVIFGAAPATLTATGGASGNPVVFATTSLATICTVSGNLVTFVGIGTCNLTANQAAAGNYSAAPQVTASIVINPAPQSITGFAPTTPVIFGAAPATLTATGGASGNPVVFATTSLATVCTVSSPTVTFTGVGTCNLTANQAAAGNYSAAPQVTASIVINPAPQAIVGFAPASPVVFGAVPATLTATGGASGNPVVFATTSLATICTVSGNLVTFVGIGTCNLTANQAAAGNYSAAPQATASIVINSAGATITGFNPPLSALVGDAPIILSATGAPSGAPIIFATTSPASVCTVSGNTVTIVGPGLCILTANQAASGNFAAAAQVTRNLAISITVPTLNAGLLIALAGLLVGIGAWTRRRG